LKVCTPDSNCVEIDGPSGRRYNFRSGMANVSDRDAKAIVAEGGFIPSMAGTTRAGIGYRCTDCGFGCWFTRCSRCGGKAVREVVH
jgi:hypothetical protein